MPSQSRTSITACPRGHQFAPATFTLTRQQIDGYLRATGDATAYGHAVPPLAAVAFGLAALQEQITLPGGSLHTGQEVSQLAPIVGGDEMTLTGRVAQRSERQGMVISVLEYEISTAAGAAIAARSTIMAPAGGAA